MLSRVLLHLLVVTLVASLPTLADAQSRTVRSDYVPQDAFVAFFGEPGRVLMEPDLAMVPREVLTAFSQDAIGVDPLEMDSLLVFLRLPTTPGAPQWGAIATFKNPQRLQGGYLEQCQELELNGKTFYVNEGFDNPPSFYLASDTTLLAGDAATVPKMLESKMADSSLIQMLDDVSVDAAHLQILVAWDMIRPMMLEELETAGPPPPPFGQLVAVGETLESIKAEVNLGTSIKARVELRTIDAEAAQETSETLQRLIDFAEVTIVAQAKQAMNDEEVVMARAMGKYLDRIGGEIAKSLTPMVDGNTVTIEVEDQFTQSGVMIALLLPAVQSAREAARRAQSVNNLRQIALAMHNYHDTFKTFPGQANFDDNDKPLLSWRVHLLPFLEQQDLYEQFHLDEPWDSDHNIKLVEKMPDVFSNPNVASDSKTVYVALASPNGIMHGKKAQRIRDILDGTSNTIMFVEANADQAVTWTQPVDLKFDPDRPLRGLGQLRPGGFHAAMCDGSVHFLAETIDQDIMRALVTADGGEAIGPLD